MFTFNTIEKINYFYEELDRLEESLDWLEKKVVTTESEKDLQYLYVQILEEKRRHDILNREFMAHLAILSQQ
jgi:hypothetical protein